VAVVALIVLAIAAAALPAYALIRGELERQAWDRVDRGAATSKALIEAELTRLSSLATLAAQRPTLRSLAGEPPSAELQTYLETFRSAAGVDDVLVTSTTGDETAAGSLSGALPCGEQVTEPAVVAIPGSGAGAALVAGADVVEEGGSRILGTVTVARLLDEGYLADLGAITGLRYSLLLDGERVATTLPGYPAVTAERSTTDAPLARRELLAASAPFYAIRTALGPPSSGLELETAFPAADLQRQARQALFILMGTTVIAAVAVSGVGLVLSRRMAGPLERLTRAAQRIRQGDLDTPVPVPEGPAEVRDLASMLEAGRVHTRETVETLLREKAWSEALIQSVVEGIVTLDRERRIATFSPGAERLIGWPAADAIGQSAASVFRTPDGSVFLEKLPPPGGRRAVQVVDRAGRTMTLSITDARLRLPRDGGERLALVMRDVSDDEAVRQLRSYFLANISHEFRTPLSAIHASVELLLEDLGGLSKDEIAGLLHSVYLSVTGLQTLIDNLLESLSIEAGRFTIRRHAAALDQAIEGSVRVMRPLLDRREHTLRLDVPARLPPVWMDPMRVTQVVVNLLSNASKYSPVRSPIDLRVDLPGDGTVRCSVSDRGEGIAPEDRANLFRRFVRLEPADPGQYGVGLGLSVVKAIVEEHGGRVGVEARPSGGSTFWFSLPLEGGLT
jgi:two-component system phosphate regulon sensor histidine kinase PhoR